MTWKPVTETDQPGPFAPGQIEPVFTPAEQSLIALYRAQVERHMLNRNQPQTRRV